MVPPSGNAAPRRGMRRGNAWAHKQRTRNVCEAPRGGGTKNADCGKECSAVLACAVDAKDAATWSDALARVREDREALKRGSDGKHGSDHARADQRTRGPWQRGPQRGGRKGEGRDSGWPALTQRESGVAVESQKRM
ncbi:hypothetical protein ERJ75_000437500 [Trypanosoma vivax]|nr:hypothetical protein ERJ75_000437500 [Trypanosoma vivax]